MVVICSKAVIYHGNDQSEYVFHDVNAFPDLPEETVKGSKEAAWTEYEAREELLHIEKHLQKSTNCKFVDTESVYFYCVDSPEWSYGIIITRNGDGFGVEKYDEAVAFYAGERTL